MNDNLQYNQSFDGGTFEEVERQPISYACLVKMAKDALWVERLYLDLDLPLEAARYVRIWGRIHKAMRNSYYIKNN